MALMPARMKWRKHHRGRMRGVATQGNTVEFGEYGIKSLEPAWITSNQIEAVRVTLSRFMKRKGKVWIRIFPHKPVTKRAAETRMGKGKGNVEFYVAVVKPGTVCFELAGLDPATAKAAIRLATAKLPVKTSTVERRA